LNVGQFVDGEFKLIWLHLLLFEEADETNLVLQKEEQSFAATVRTTTRPAHSVDVIIGIIWGVVLDNPVHLWKVEASLRHIRTQEDAVTCLTELEVGACALLLLLLTVDVFNGNINVVEQVRVKLHCITARHEDHNLLGHVFP